MLPNCSHFLSVKNLANFSDIKKIWVTKNDVIESIKLQVLKYLTSILLWTIGEIEILE